MPICSSSCGCSQRDLKEVVFQGAIDPHTPIGQGWLRASHRKLDKKLSTALSALSHAMTRSSRSRKARWSSSTSRSGRPRSWCRPGYRIGLTIRGKDYVYAGPSGGKLSNFKNELTGCGPFLHDDPVDRPHGHFRRRHQPAFRRAANGPICCCRSFRQKERFPAPDVVTCAGLGARCAQGSCAQV